MALIKEKSTEEVENFEKDKLNLDKRCFTITQNGEIVNAFEEKVEQELIFSFSIIG